MVFSGTTSTDFMKLVSIPETKKEEFINFGSDDFLTIREDLISYIKAVYPLDFDNFSESDLGMMLVELVAYMGAVFSLKGDMLANENYLRTVKSRENLRKLLELIGVDLRGPLAAAASCKMTATTAPTVANFPLTFTPGNRVFAITSREDGAAVNYTLYKLVNNFIQDITSTTADISLAGDEADNATSSVFTNVALLEGALSKEDGIFELVEGNKQVALLDSPIIDGSVQVYVTAGVGDAATGAYKEVERLYAASGATDRVFQVIYDDNFAGTVLFGDNIAGVSPPPGAEYTIVYRTGGGSRGNIIREAINVTLTADTADETTLSFIVENSTAATGGADAETMEEAKKYAPLEFKRQDRVVTLEDYVSIGNSFLSKQGTVGKTTAVVRDAFSSANVIDLYTLEKASDLHLQKASPTFKKELLDEIEPKKMLTDEVVVCDGLIRTLDLVVTIRIDKNLSEKEGAIRQEVVSVILDFFSVDNMDFGKTFVAADLNRAIFELPNVRFSTIDNTPQTMTVDFNEIIQLNNFTVNMVTV